MNAWLVELRGLEQVHTQKGCKWSRLGEALLAARAGVHVQVESDVDDDFVSEVLLTHNVEKTVAQMVELQVQVQMVKMIMQYVGKEIRTPLIRQLRCDRRRLSTDGAECHRCYCCRKRLIRKLLSWSVTRPISQSMRRWLDALSLEWLRSNSFIFICLTIRCPRDMRFPLRMFLYRKFLILVSYISIAISIYLSILRFS